MGYSEEMLGKPIIGITNTYSDYNPCHGNVPDLIKSVKAGILSSGAIPLEFPTITIHESFAYPTSMYLRNLMSIDTEEMLRAQPMDSCVLIGGCDKTVPAQLMGGFSSEIPIIQLVTGPMLTGSYNGERVGACTDCRRFWASYRAEEINLDEINKVNNQLVPTVGTCGVMGTASTMAILTEALGLMIPSGACAPAVSSERRRIAEKTGIESVRIANLKHIPKKKVFSIILDQPTSSFSFKPQPQSILNPLNIACEIINMNNASKPPAISTFALTSTPIIIPIPINKVIHIK